MRLCSAFFVLCLLPAALHGQAANPNTIRARTVYHQDGTRTESVSDPAIRELNEVTYNANNIVVIRKRYLLNERGQPMQGLIYDGSGALKARMQMTFDAFGREQEERLLNLQGEMFQQTIYEYGPDGKPKKPKVINYNVSAPTMRPQMIDFTKSMPPPGSPPPVAPQTGMPQAQEPAAADDGKPKKSFWQRLGFGKKDKDK